MCEGGTAMPARRRFLPGPRALSGLPRLMSGLPRAPAGGCLWPPGLALPHGAWSPRACGACEGPRLAWLSPAACPCPPCGSLASVPVSSASLCLGGVSGCLSLPQFVCFSVFCFSPSFLTACLCFCVCVSASAWVCEYVCLSDSVSVCLLSLPGQGVGEGRA